MENCFEELDVEDLSTCGNNEISSGVSEIGLRYANIKQITSFPKLPKLSDNLPIAQSAVAVGNFEFIEGKGFGKIDIQMDTGQFMAEGTGNTGNVKIKNKLEGFIPGNSKQTLGWIRKFNNVSLVFAVRDKEGVVFIVGTPNAPAFIKPSYSTGKTGEDDKGASFTIECTHPPMIYEGDIPLQTAI